MRTWPGRAAPGFGVAFAAGCVTAPPEGPARDVVEARVAGTVPDCRADDPGEGTPGSIVVSPDARHVAWVAEATDRLRWLGGMLGRFPPTRLVIDDAPGSKRGVIPSPIAFDGPATVRFFEARRDLGPFGSGIRRVSETLR